MPEEYDALVTKMKALTKEGKTLPVGRDFWDTRPQDDNYGFISLDFEAGSLEGDNLKQHRAFDGSMDLFSRKRDGDGWVKLIEQTLTEHCECNWSLNLRVYERDTALYHWEWVFEIEG